MRVIIFMMLLSMSLIVTEDIDGTFRWEQINLPAVETAEEHARMAFEYFFRYGKYGVPQGVEVLSIEMADGLLTVDVSEDILGYGGSAFERALVAQLKQIASDIPGADSLTLLIEGEEGLLVQGTAIYRAGLNKGT